MFFLRFLNSPRTMKGVGNGFWLLIVASFLATCCCEPISGCPQDPLFAPCLCHKGPSQGPVIDCSDVRNIKDLADSFSVQFEDPGEFEELVIEGSPLWYLPADIFSPIKVGMISIRQNANLTDIEEDTFRGSEDYIRILYMDKNSIEETDIFNAIIKMKILTFASLNGNRLPSVPDRALAGLPELMGVDLSNNRISKLGREAFADCPNLRNVFLYNNQLSVLPGRILALDKSVPVDKKEVLLLYLYRNHIDEFEPDAFDGIQKTVQISLNENRLQILPRKLFKPVLDTWLSKRNDSAIFILTDNPFVCDCRMRWLLENRDYFKILTEITCFDTKKPLESYNLEDFGQCP